MTTGTPAGDALSPKLSVVICSLNGAAGVERCLRALARQTLYSQLEIIVSDDGSTDRTSEVARGHGAIVVRSPTNRGVSAARNSGVQAASAPIVAFIDDDCEPEAQWAEKLLGAYDEEVVAAGGLLLVAGKTSCLLGYLTRHNPLEPLELELAKSDKARYRLYLYLRRQWRPATRSGVREVFSFASANMSVRRHEFMRIGGFDERFRFGSEDEDLCRRLRREFPGKHLIFTPDARVRHYFKASVRDTLRRRRAYGRGSAQLYRKWPNVRPTFFPAPLIMLTALALSMRVRTLLIAAALLPLLFYPQGLRTAVATARLSVLLDAYLQLMEESSHDAGFAQGWWAFRQLVAEPDPGKVSTVDRRVASVP